MRQIFKIVPLQLPPWLEQSYQFSLAILVSLWFPVFCLAFAERVEEFGTP